MKIDDIKRRVDELLKMGEATLQTKYSTGGGDYPSPPPQHFVQLQAYSEWHYATLSFLHDIFKEKPILATEFQGMGFSATPGHLSRGIGILKTAKFEIENGWLTSFKGVVSAEIFSDFLEMAAHLLEQGYKDPAAVMTGSVLEEHLRQLCQNNFLPIETQKDGKSIPKKADTMNAELKGAGAYDLLNQKSVTAWLELRNKAAHGKYDEYTKEQVKLMLQGVTDFIARTS